MWCYVKFGVGGRGWVVVAHIPTTPTTRIHRSPAHPGSGLFRDGHDPAGLVVGQRIEQNGLYDAEDGCVGAYPERKRHHSDNEKPGWSVKRRKAKRTSCIIRFVQLPGAASAATRVTVILISLVGILGRSRASRITWEILAPSGCPFTT